MSTKNTQLGFRRQVIPANLEVEIAVPSATQIRFFDAGASFSIALDGGELVPMTKGKRLRLPIGDDLTKIKIQDTSGAENFVAFYFGNVDISDDTLNVIGVEQVAIAGSITDIVNPVDVGNFPASQTVNGTVTVGALPAVAIAAGQTVDIGNLPASQTVDGTVTVSALPAVAIAAGQEVTNTPKAASVTLDGATYTTDGNDLNGKRWVKVTNTDATENLTVSVNSLSKTLAHSEAYETPQLNQGESIPTVTVDAATSSAVVEFLNA